MTTSWSIFVFLLIVQYLSRFASQVVRTSKVDQLRAQFGSEDVTSVTRGIPIKAYILPNTDAHLNTWMAEREFRIKFLTGFTGSYAKVVITNDKAIFWTNSEFYSMAKNVLDPSFILINDCKPGAISLEESLIDNLATGEWVGIDPSLHCLGEAQKLMKRLKAVGINVALIGQNLVDKIWKERPAHQMKAPIVLSHKEHGRDAVDKIRQLREKIAKKKCTAIILSALDEIMWLLNIRGYDIEYNPLAYSYALVTLNEVHLFMDKADENMKTYLRIISVALHPYGEAYAFLANWNRQQLKQNKIYHSVFVPTYTNYLFGSLFDDISLVCESPVKRMKSVKNHVELEGMRNANIRDSVAMVEFLKDIEDKIVSGEKLLDYQAGYNLHILRIGQEKFVEMSYKAKAASGENSAEIHYYGSKPVAVTTDKAFLIDSGAHYRDGTTSVARTIWIATENSAVPEDFILKNTLILKGHINLANSMFPPGTSDMYTEAGKSILCCAVCDYTSQETGIFMVARSDNQVLLLNDGESSGIRLDALVRYPLWQEGLDYKHQSGQGVGHFLTVHESPNIGLQHEEDTSSRIKEGMTLTINPGYYLEGKWGAQLKNTYEVVNMRMPSGENFLGFEALSLVPIHTNLIDKTMLSYEEVQWLNTYHDRVLEIVGEHLYKANKTDTLEWLKKECAPVLRTPRSYID